MMGACELVNGRAGAAAGEQPGGNKIIQSGKGGE